MSLLGLQRDGSGPALVWLHGFTQTKATGHRFRSILAGSYEVLTIDLPGHGENATTTASLEETADLLAQSLPREPFILGGYSLGGRVALHFALAYPDRLSSLSLLSASAGIAGDLERQERRARDEALALRIESIGTSAFLDEWLNQPMFETLTNDPLERASRSRDAHGLAQSLRSSGAGTQAWLGERLRGLRVATTIVAGERDAKFVDVAEQLASSIEDATVAFVPDAGHAAHLERPEAAAKALFGVSS